MLSGGLERVDMPGAAATEGAHCQGAGETSEDKKQGLVFKGTESARLGLCPWISPCSVFHLKSRKLSVDNAKAPFQL